MTSEHLPATTQGTDEKRELALLKAVGLDKLTPEQRELALNIASRYELDLLLKHLVIIEGRAYITRDGLIHVAHRSGVFEGIEVSPVVKDGTYLRATCSVWRKDMARPFTYPGRYPTTGGNSKYNEEMAVKVAEVAALRRAFDVSAPTVEERWDGAETEPVEAPAKGQSLAEIARSRAATVQDAPQAVEEAIVVSEPTPEPIEAQPPAACASASPYAPDCACVLDAGHPGNHRTAERESWQS